MESISISLPDGSIMEIAQGTTVAEVAARIGRRLAAAALCAEVGGRLVDLSERIPAPEDGTPVLVRILTWADREGRSVYWHTAAHVMAAAVTRLFPGAKLSIGPAIDTGYYYDFDVGRPFTPEDLERIEAEMKDIIGHDLPFRRFQVSRDRARELFANQPYKLELIEDLDPDEPICCYQQGEFIDLCAGPHLPSTNRLGVIKLLNAAGAYWRGDERNPMLQRIYGLAFPNRRELDEHLERLAEAERRDHRRLGQQLDLFSIHPEVGAGLVHWHPRAALVRSLAEDYWRQQHLEHGYQLVYSPHIGRAGLWETSGHLGYYSENMYAPMLVDDQEYYLKPMNCPFHIMIYRNEQRSYRDLPIRFAELGTVYRYERSGVLHGLLRVRGFTQDDAHIFCAPDQIEQEILGVLDFTLQVWRAFGFSEFEFFLSTRPEQSVGSDEMWDQATGALERAMQARGLDYERDEGGGVFYGPKIDIGIRDALGRDWQCTTIQFDFNLPERFDITFIGADGKEHRPYMVHRALLGSLERFFGILVEHYAGAFPLWLAPVQALVLPVTDRHGAYAGEVAEQLRAAGVRVEIDGTSDTVSYRIRQAQLNKVPYMLVVGDREQEQASVAVRERSAGDLGAMSVDEFCRRVAPELKPGS